MYLKTIGLLIGTKMDKTLSFFCNMSEMLPTPALYILVPYINNTYADLFIFNCSFVVGLAVLDTRRSNADYSLLTKVVLLSAPWLASR